MERNTTNSVGEWPERFSRWKHHLSESGLGDIFQMMVPMLEFMGPIAAQVVWLAQPAMGAFGQAQEAATLAVWLENPSAATTDSSTSATAD